MHCTNAQAETARSVLIIEENYCNGCSGEIKKSSKLASMEQIAETEDSLHVPDTLKIAKQVHVQVERKPEGTLSEYGGLWKLTSKVTNINTYEIDFQKSSALSRKPNITKIEPKIHQKLNEVNPNKFFSFKTPYPYVILSVGLGFGISGQIRAQSISDKWDEYLSNNPGDIERRYTRENSNYKRYQALRNTGIAIIAAYSLGIILDKIPKSGKKNGTSKITFAAGANMAKITINLQHK